MSGGMGGVYLDLDDDSGEEIPTGERCLEHEQDLNILIHGDRNGLFEDEERGKTTETCKSYENMDSNCSAMFCFIPCKWHFPIIQFLRSALASNNAAAFPFALC